MPPYEAGLNLWKERRKCLTLAHMHGDRSEKTLRGIARMFMEQKEAKALRLREEEEAQRRRAEEQRGFLPGLLERGGDFGQVPTINTPIETEISRGGGVMSIASPPVEGPRMPSRLPTPIELGATEPAMTSSLSAPRLGTTPEIVTDKDGKPRGILFGDEYEKNIYSWLVLLDGEGEPVFKAPPDGYPDRGDGLDWKKVFGGV